MIALGMLLLQVAATDSETANRVYVDCAIKQARELDDGTSDAATVGKIVAASCAAERRQAVAAFVMAEPISTTAKSSMINKIMEGDDNMGTKIVLKVRAQRRKASQP